MVPYHSEALLSEIAMGRNIVVSNPVDNILGKGRRSTWVVEILGELRQAAMQVSDRGG